MTTDNIRLDRSTAAVHDRPPTAESSPTAPAPSIVSYWPLVLFLLGGLLGGLLGCVAAVINGQIMRTNLPRVVKYPLVVATGVVALLAWFLIVAALSAAA